MLEVRYCLEQTAQLQGQRQAEEGMGGYQRETSDHRSQACCGRLCWIGQTLHAAWEWYVVYLIPSVLFFLPLPPPHFITITVQLHLTFASPPAPLRISFPPPYKTITIGAQIQKSRVWWGKVVRV